MRSSNHAIMSGRPVIPVPILLRFPFTVAATGEAQGLLKHLTGVTEHLESGSCGGDRVK